MRIFSIRYAVEVEVVAEVVRVVTAVEEVEVVEVVVWTMAAVAEDRRLFGPVVHRDPVAARTTIKDSRRRIVEANRTAVTALPIRVDNRTLT